MVDTGASVSSPFGALKELVAQSERVARAEVRLMMAEYTSSATLGIRRLVVFVVGGVFACFAAGYLLYAAFLALLQVLVPWEAALLLGATLGLLSGVLFAAGLRGTKGRDIKLAPQSLLKLTRGTDD